MILLSVTWVLFYLLVPALVILLCERVKLFNKIGTILTLYFIGIIFSNLFVFPFQTITNSISGVQNAISSITIPLAMPLILFSCNFKRLPLRSATLSMIFGIISVVCAIISGYFIFEGKVGDEEFNNIAGMLVGVYTGGTPNLAALKMMLGVDEATYILINSFDMIVSLAYITFLLTIGIKLFRLALPYKTEENVSTSSISNQNIDTNSTNKDLYHNVFTKSNFFPTILSILLSVSVAGVSIGISFLITGKIDMLTLFLSLTTIAIALSFVPSIKRAEKSYDAGMYLVLIFSLVIASMVNISEINFKEGLWFLLYIVYAIFGSLAIQLLLSKIFKINADITIITSVALINSPLFVPMIADCMKNKSVIIVGITIGIIGYAIGNYLGAVIAMIL